MKLYNLNIERELCAIIATHGGGVFHDCSKLCDPSDFYDKEMSDIWRAFQMCYDEGDIINLSNVIRRMPAVKNTVLSLDYEIYTDPLPMAAEVHTLALKRDLQRIILETSERLGDPDDGLDEVVNDLQAAINGIKCADPLHTVRWSQLQQQVLKHVEAMMNGETVDTGMMTNISYIDTHGGLRPGDLNIIAGRTSNGKTSLAMTIALNTAMLGNPVLVFSLEMSLDDIAYRIAAMLGGIPASRIERDRLLQAEFDRLFAALWPANVANAPLLFDNKRSSDFSAIVASIRTAARDYDVKVIVIDYVQLMRDKGENRSQVIGGMANKLKALAVELDICIILLSQLARQMKGASAKPNLNELKESGDLENAADNVWMPYRAEHSNELYPQPYEQYDTRGTALVYNYKSRKGSTGEFMLGFDAQTTRFYDRETFATISNTAPSDDPF